MNFRQFFLLLSILIVSALFTYLLVWFSKHNNKEIRKLKAEMAWSHIVIGNEKYELGDPHGAIEEFTKAIQSNPNQPVAYSSRADVKESLGDKHGAISDYSYAIRLNKTMIRAGNLLEEGNNVLGNRQNADFNRDGLDQFNSQLSGAYFKRGLLMYKIGNKPAGFEDLQRTIEISKRYGRNDIVQGVLECIEELS
jgi:tetratricopeptide (TPR) repeat protein